MFTEQKGRPGQGAQSRTTVCVDPQSTKATDNPWWVNIDWWTLPATAYARGVEDGVRLADERFAAWLVAVLPAVLGQADLGDGVRSLIRYQDQVAARGGTSW